jgi:hypothetical protein
MPINLPFDFQPIGLDYMMSNATFHRINGTPANRAWLQSKIQHIPMPLMGYINNGLFFPIRETPDTQSRFTLNGQTYRIDQLIGVSTGAIGFTTRIINIVTNQHYFLHGKVLNYIDNGNIVALDELPFLKQIMIHSILDINTRNPDGTNNYVAKLLNVFYNNYRTTIYWITETLDNTCFEYLELAPNLQNKAERIMTCCRQLTDKLEHLYNLCNFNHGFLRTNKVWCAGQEFKFLDFSHSIITVGAGNILQVGPDITTHRAGRDITIFIKSIFSSHRIGQFAHHSDYTRYVHAILSKPMNALCSIVHPPRFINAEQLLIGAVNRGILPRPPDEDVNRISLAPFDYDEDVIIIRETHGGVSHDHMFKRNVLLHAFTHSLNAGLPLRNPATNNVIIRLRLGDILPDPLVFEPGIEIQIGRIEPAPPGAAPAAAAPDPPNVVLVPAAAAPAPAAPLLPQNIIAMHPRANIRNLHYIDAEEWFNNHDNVLGNFVSMRTYLRWFAERIQNNQLALAIDIPDSPEAAAIRAVHAAPGNAVPPIYHIAGPPPPNFFNQLIADVPRPLLLGLAGLAGALLATAGMYMYMLYIRFLYLLPNEPFHFGPPRGPRGRRSTNKRRKYNRKHGSRRRTRKF